MKRFYQTVAIVPADSDAGYVVTLDGKVLSTPGKAKLVIPSAGLAGAIAEEWAAQEEEVHPTRMPLTRLAATATDRVAQAREAIVDELMRFAGSDLLCYRAAAPDDLRARQEAVWQPLLDWAAVRFGAELRTVTGLMPEPQPEGALAMLRAALEALDDLALTGLMVATAAAGSLIVGLAIVERRLSGEEAFAVSQLDETFQIEQWGEDFEAAARRAALREDLLAVERFLALRLQ